jgi:transcriptional regulator
MPDANVEVLRGTLDMLILKALTGGATHGYAVARWIEQATDDVLRIEEGSLYPALHRMMQDGWLRAEWGVTEKKREAKFYRLTRTGRRQLERQTQDWQQATAIVARFLSPSGEG